MLRKKKLFSMIISLSMVLTMFLGNLISVNAAENVIESVTITELPVFEVGASIADAKATADVPEGCIATSQWYIWDAEESWTPISEGVFSETDIYFLCVEFETVEGYSFSEENFEVNYADGIEEGSVYGEYDEEDNLTYHCEMQKVSFATPIYKIDFEIPEVKVGNTATLENITFYSEDEVVAAENFEINAAWECIEHYEDATGEVFEDDHVYQFVLDVIPKDGYYFADTIEAYCNGEADEFAFGTEPTHYNYVYTKSLLDPIEKVEINGIPEVKVGETMPDTFEVLTPMEDYSGEIFFYWWSDESDDTAGEVMEEGQIYTLQIEVNMFGNYPLSEDFVYVIDGEEYEASDLTESQAFFELKYDFRDNTVIDDDNTEDDKENSKAPLTGDYSYMVLLVAFAFISIAAGVFFHKRVR